MLLLHAQSLALIQSNVLWPGSTHRQWWLDVLSAAVSGVAMEKCQPRYLVSYFLKGAAAPHSNEESRGHIIPATHPFW